MRKLFAVLLALAALAPAAHAATTVRYVGLTALHGGNGHTADSCMTLASANADTLTDVIYNMAAAAYVTNIAPARSGTSNQRRIAYCGILATPASVSVPNITMSTNYVTVKGVVTSGTSDFVMEGAFDSVYVCILNPGAFYIDDDGHYSVLSGSTISTHRFQIEGVYPSAGNGAADTLNAVPIRGITIDNSTINVVHQSDFSQASWRTASAESLTVKNSRFTITENPGAVHGTWKTYFSKHETVKDCSLTFVQNIYQPDGAGCDECGTGYIRDATRFATFLRDTILWTGTNRSQLLFSGAGSFGSSTYGNTWDSCIFRQTVPSIYGAVIFWQDRERAGVFKNCVVISAVSAAFDHSRVDNTNHVYNNTFVRLGSGDAVVRSNDNATSLDFHDNLMYTVAQPGIWFYFGDYTGDYDLLWTNGGSQSTAAVYGNPTRTTVAFPFDGQDSHSTFGNPLMVGGADALTFDAHLASVNSAAIGHGTGGATIGAYPYASQATGAIYVNASTGNDNNDGSSGAPFATIGKANTVVGPGYPVYVYPGTYTDFPNPVNSTSAGENCYIAVTSGTPVRLLSGMLTRPYTSLRSFTLDSLRASETADFDSVFSCTAAGDLHWDGDYGLVYGSTFAGQRLGIGDVEPSNTCSASAIIGCTFPNLGVGYQGNGIPLFRRTKVDSLTFYFNTLSATLENFITAAPSFQKDSLVTNLKSRGNHITVTDNRPAAPVYAYTQMGAGSRSNSFDCDTLAVLGSGGGTFELTSPMTTPDLTASTTWDSCSIQALGLTRGSYAAFANGMAGATLTYTTIAMNGPALAIPWITQPLRSTINHCTIVGVPSVRPDSIYTTAVVALTNPYSKPAFTDTCITITNCIIAGIGTSGVNPDTTIGLIAWHDGTVDSARSGNNNAGAGKAQKHLLSNNNLYSWYGYGVNPADRAWLNFQAPSARKTGSWRPGQAAPSASWWNTDSLSRNGTAGFFDSTTTQGTLNPLTQNYFNPRLRGYSNAIGIGTSGTAAGAVAYTSNSTVTVTDPNGNPGGSPSVTLHISQAANETTYVDVNNTMGNVGVALLTPLATDPLGQQLNFYATTLPTVNPKSVFQTGDQPEQLSTGTNRYFLTLKPGSTLTGNRSLVFRFYDDYFGLLTVPVLVKYVP